jgi:HK97 gp10 family phage protein
VADNVHIKGLKELHAMLQTVPIKIERNIMRGAMRAGANVIAKQARANVPVSEPSDRNRERYGAYAGALRDTIRTGNTRSRKGRVTASIRAGGVETKGSNEFQGPTLSGRALSGGPVFWATWVEYGTKPHSNGRRGMHPGARPNPFLRPAADTKQAEAVVAVGKYVYRRLEQRGGLDMPDIVVEEE